QAQVYQRGSSGRPPVLVVNGAHGSIPTRHREPLAGVHVPDGILLASLVGGAFDLGRGCRCPPQESLRETICQFSSCHQPFTAPAMIPETSCFPATTKTSSRGSVARTAPARTME